MSPQDQTLVRPSIAMIEVNHPVFGSWLRAASMSSPVLRLRIRETSRSPLVRIETLDSRIEISIPRLRPSRLLWRVSAVIAALAVRRAIAQYEAATGIEVGLFHGHFASASTALPLVLRWGGVPYVITEHNSSLLDEPAKPLTPAGERLARYVYSSASTVITVSDLLKDHIQRRFSPPHCTTIPNPVDIERIARRASAERQVDVVTVSRLVPVKRVDRVLRAFSRSGLTGRLVVVGDGPERERLEGLATSLGISARTSFRGVLPADEVAGLMTQARFFVAMSDTETFGLTAVEALAAGCHVVVTPTPAISSYEDLPMVTVVGRGDVEAAADALKDEAQFAAQEFDALVERLSAEFSIGTQADRLREVYDAVLQPESSVSVRPQRNGRSSCSAD